MEKRRIYLDNNATTMVDPKIDNIDLFNLKMYGNPNSLHTFGTEIHKYMENALDSLYKGVGASSNDSVIVTGCATESNNAVLKSIYFSEILSGKKSQIITTSVEHHSISNSCSFLESLGVEVIYAPVNSDGIITVDILKKYLDPKKCALVSIMWANNETGLINPIKELAEWTKSQGVLFHTDAVQAVGKIPINLKELSIDYLSFSAHKFHGPKGVGALYIKEGVPFTPLLHGGEQMAGLRSGTINVSGLVAMGKAMDLAVENLNYENNEVRRLRDKLEDTLIAKISDSYVLGKKELRTANTLFISFKGVEGEAMLWDLNRAGIAASTGSACASESLESSPIFKAFGLSDNLAHTGIRFSLSRFTTEEEIDITVNVVIEAVKRIREISNLIS